MNAVPQHSARRELTIVVIPLLHQALKKMAADDQRSLSNLARKVLADHLRNHGYLTEEELRADFLRP
jgi:predicted HicB family RNase H-like nuclease